MATINQSPAGQATVALDIDVDLIDVRGTPSWRSRKTVTGVTGVFIAPKATALAGRLMGKSAAVTPSSAYGVWTLADQLAAKRLGAWP